MSSAAQPQRASRRRRSLDRRQAGRYKSGLAAVLAEEGTKGKNPALQVRGQDGGKGREKEDRGREGEEERGEERETAGGGERRRAREIERGRDGERGVQGGEERREGQRETEKKKERDRERERLLFIYLCQGDLKHSLTSLGLSFSVRGVLRASFRPGPGVCRDPRNGGVLSSVGVMQGRVK